MTLISTRILTTLKPLLLESQSDTSVYISELANIDFPTQRAELHPEKEASSIEKIDFLVFMDIIGKLTEDVRSL